MANQRNEQGLPQLRIITMPAGQLAVVSSDPSILMEPDSLHEAIVMLRKKADEADEVIANTKATDEEVYELHELLHEIRSEFLKGDTEWALELIGREIGY